MLELFYPDTLRYTPEGREVDTEARQIIKPLFDKYMEQGCTYREISHVVMHTLLSIESEIALIDQHRAALINRGINEKNRR